MDSLPPIIQGLLESALTAANGNGISVSTISDILIKAISEVDNRITCDIVDLFPRDPEGIAKLSYEEIDAIVNDFGSGGRNNAKILRGLRGSTALVSIVDAAQENLWVASLGDCQAGNYYTSYAGARVD